MQINKLVRIGCRDRFIASSWQSAADKDVINRSLPSTYPHYFVKEHYRAHVAMHRFMYAIITGIIGRLRET